MKVAIIPARGGSKRIPLKNIKLFAGKPLIIYSIEAALQAKIFDRVFVSTDSPEIAEIANQAGAEIPFMRPTHLADDFTGTDAVILDALKSLIEMGFPVKYVCCIYATAPFIRPEDLTRGYDILCSNMACSAFTVTTFPAPIFRSLKKNGCGRLEMVWPEHRMTRSQDLPETFHDAGQFYWADVEKYLDEKSFWSTDAVPIRLPRHRVQDIDTLEDWDMAEKIFKLNGMK